MTTKEEAKKQILTLKIELDRLQEIVNRPEYDINQEKFKNAFYPNPAWDVEYDGNKVTVTVKHSYIDTAMSDRLFSVGRIGYKVTAIKFRQNSTIVILDK